MIIKHYADVPPSPYAGTPDGVQMREMITGQDGAPNFSLRVFDVQPGAGTPFHTHQWEHEVFILAGTGNVVTEGCETPFRAGDAVYIAPEEKHCFVADPAAAVRFICVIPSRNQCRM
ncbi:MAG: cupin domain-containing protein [Nitrospirae bacterium]|nr:cupin domain-containing protein [Nitrospirota bacterium]